MSCTPIPIKTQNSSYRYTATISTRKHAQMYDSAGEHQIQSEALKREWVGTWTHISFSFPTLGIVLEHDDRISGKSC